MRRKIWRVLALLVPVALVAGCGKEDKKAAVPTNLEQKLPEGVSTGGGGPAKSGKKASQGGAVAD
jgi:nitrous oxide reductase accessory protein NosL